MALLFMDSFDHYATADKLKKWSGKTTGYGYDPAIVAGGRRSTNAISLGYDSSLTWVAPVPSAGTWILGLAIKAVDEGWSFGMSNAVSGRVRVVPNGSNGLQAQVYNGSSWAGIGDTRASLMSAGVWYYIELKAKLHGSTGTMEIRVNGVSELALTGQNTMFAGVAVFTSFYLNGITWDGPYIVYDDLYLLDNSGSINNNFLGDMRVDAHFPVTPDGTHQDWTPSTGSDRFAVVDDPSANITDYNATLTLNDIDTLNIENMKNPGGSIAGLQTMHYHSKADAGACLVAPIVRSGGADYVGSNFAPSVDSFAFQRTLYETNPATGLQWAESEFDAVEIGYKKTG